ncbi:PEP-CTERM sorting domain-containing protein [Azohydromonas caseinilytica]|uniref:PEP-CTERM sorting domain-containing protein n=1 Tax=Azohydromonas caseinilytica TaxID=2728836 RepID=A0A848FIW1_9BURK|nr:PEP-CTERM sorting domain-containing protein [Azohydromonas caseinilytica]NML18835.1 PEP-CTERM sorting domain-containing protein [Azohydromonas caseinilytica]
MQRSVRKLVGLAAITLAAPTHATLTHFSERQAFDAVLRAPATVERFTDDAHFPISTGVLNARTNLVVDHGTPIRPGDIRPGATYSTAIGREFFFNIDWSGTSDGGFLDGFVQPNGNPLTVTFDRPVAAFGFDTNRYMGSKFDLTVRFTHGPDQILSYATEPTFEHWFFHGFVSDRRDIASLVIEGDSQHFSSFAFALDNFTFSPPVPEPSAWALLLGGLCALGGMTRTRRQP